MTELTCIVHHVLLLYTLFPDGSVLKMDKVNFNSLQVNFPVFDFTAVSCNASMKCCSSPELGRNKV